MTAPAQRKTAFERIKAGLEQCIQYTRGETTLRTTLVPTRPPQLSAKRIVQLRRSLQQSQHQFAQMLNVPIKTVQAWEQGTRKPSQVALRLLQILSAKPEVVGEVVGVPVASHR